MSTSKEVEEIVNGKKYTGCFQDAWFLEPDGDPMAIGIITSFKMVL